MLDGIEQATQQHAPASAARSRRHRATSILGLVVGLLALVAALAVPFAPVLSERSTITWPQAGQQPTSTTAFLVPYHPGEVHVRVPCRVVRNAAARGEPATVVSSRPPGQPTEGFAVTTAGSTVLALVAGQEALRAPIGPGCDVAVDGDASGSTARIGDREAHLPGQRIRDVVAFATDLSPAQAAGAQVQVRTPNWYANSPSGAKQLLIAVQLLLVVAAFGLLLRIDARRPREPVTPLPARPGRRAIGYAVDLLVGAVLAGWWLLGPTGPDDSFAAVTVQNGLDTGAITNYYRWENAGEAPFTLVQHLLLPVAQWNPNALAMRIPSVLAALLTWLLLSRGILGAVLPGQHRRPPIRLLAALAFVAWWIPFGLGVRPEPFEALGLAAVLAAALRAVRTDRVAWLGVAALAAGLSVAVNPMGITAIAPLVVLLPRLRRLASWPAAALTAGIAATGVLAMFADQSLAGALQATEVHARYGPDVPWFQEILRYQYLLGFDLQGDVARRAAVLLTLAVGGYSALLLLRGAGRAPGLRLAHVPVAVLLLSVALMALTPSKWTHYFGALAGVGAAALTTGVVLVGVAAATASRDRAVLIGGGVFTALLAVTAALVFAGKNNWFLHSQLGVLWGAQPVRPLNAPLVWLLLAGLLVGAFALRGRAGRGLIRAPAALGAGAMGVAVTVVLGSFALAPIRQADAYSIGGQNIAALGDGSCGLADQVVATPDVPGGALRGGDGAATVGFTAGSGAATGPPPSGTRFWGSLTGGQINTGSLTTGWFQLPEGPEGRELAFPVAGRSGDGNRVAVQFDTGDEVVLDDGWRDADERPAYPTDHVVEDRPQDRPAWRDLSVPADRVPDGATRVRVRAEDTTTDPAGWVAVAGPRLREVVPMSTYLRSDGPVLPDWSMAWNVPCVRDLPRIRDGVVQPPAYLLVPPRSMGFGGEAAYTRAIGGSFAGVREVGVQREIPTRLLGARETPRSAEWGHLIEVRYPFPDGRFDVQREPVRRWGWRGE
ncbi:arabinosyltransferase domain-containing protein [Saccharopolyspora griseoalba]|uniref:Arabinosyltransferase domain-containing protein n=1 Tax=Saccharopolyspora griseoalba TaxID=1431848 RepID=A0ABW2LIT2_9PSEU